MLNDVIQISTIQFESMQPIGVEILSSIIDKVLPKLTRFSFILLFPDWNVESTLHLLTMILGSQFQAAPDPELPGHLLLEQYQVLFLHFHPLVLNETENLLYLLTCYKSHFKFPYPKVHPICKTCFELCSELSHPKSQGHVLTSSALKSRLS